MGSNRYEKKTFNRLSQFDELVTTSETTTFSLTSQWNDLTYRNIVFATGSAGVSNVSGSFRLTTGTTSGSSVAIESKQAGIYKPGSTALAGLGTRAVQTGSLFDMRYGFYDDNNGFGWGYDETEPYVFFRRYGNETKFYQSNWNQRTLKGEGDQIDYDPHKLNIHLIEYVWYGSGKIAWTLANSTGRDYEDLARAARQVAHVYDPYDDDSYSGPSIPQPDQPFTVEVTNKSSTDDVIVDLTGRAYRRLDQGFSEQRRIISQEINQYQLTAGEGVWEAIYAFRKTETHNNFINHLNVRLEGTDVYSDENATFKVTQNNTVNEGGSTFSPPDGWAGQYQSGVEVARAANLDVQDDGKPVGHTFVRGASGGGQVGKQSGGGNVRVNPPIGRQEVIVLWARQDTNNATTVDATVSHSESY